MLTLFRGSHLLRPRIPTIDVCEGQETRLFLFLLLFYQSI